jgi:hypothetical protein
MLALAMAAATLGTVSVAQAQPMGNQQMGGQQMGDRHADQDHRGDRPMRGPGRQDLVTRDQSGRLLSTIRDLDNQIARAGQTHRIDGGAARGLRNQVAGIKQRYWTWTHGPLSRGGYEAIGNEVSRVRDQFNDVAQRGHRRH